MTNLNNYEKKLTWIFIFVIWGTLLTPSTIFSSNISELINIRYPSSYDFKKKIVNRVYEYNSYKVRKNYPSLDVYYFYKNILDKLDFKEINIDNIDSTRWFAFIDGTIKSEPVIHQFTATWVDNKQENMCFLVIDYYSKNRKISKHSNPDNNIQHISFQKVPYVTNEEK